MTRDRPNRQEDIFSDLRTNEFAIQTDIFARGKVGGDRAMEKEAEADRRREKTFERHEADTMTEAELAEMQLGAAFFAEDELAELTAARSASGKPKRTRGDKRDDAALPGKKRQVA